ncbi:sulfite exporter TauE/SafE family protein [Sporosalibacterium faouarense]|uniref:sulfite exporter TauE/SafE family protein n=1 Tax=Sporosalibacterium faouarense TaxID=516123 RepID=UPI00141C95A5|nr:sulfite exporter TauE/SafE family protein [Sporosalibacterium faouarense]MTI46734.1 sulfite exporter TauE/SafE family protein [Bacillota bacterium]
MGLTLTTQIIIGLIIIFLAGMIQGITSFGFSLLAVPLLGLFLPLQIVVPMLVIYSLFLNSIILFNVKNHVNLRKIAILVIAGIIGTPLGTYLLKALDENILKVSVGIIVTLSAVAFLRGFKIHVKNEKLSFIPVGFISGLLNGSVSLSGPPIILFLTNQGVEKQTFRANLTSYFWVLNLITIPTYIVSDLITKDVITYTSYLFPALIIGVLSGIKIGNKVDEGLFKKMTLVLIVFMGVLSIISGIK